MIGIITNVDELKSRMEECGYSREQIDEELSKGLPRFIELSKEFSQ